MATDQCRTRLEAQAGESGAGDALESAHGRSIRGDVTIGMLLANVIDHDISLRDGERAPLDERLDEGHQVLELVLRERARRTIAPGAGRDRPLYSEPSTTDAEHAQEDPEQCPARLDHYCRRSAETQTNWEEPAFRDC